MPASDPALDPAFESTFDPVPVPETGLGAFERAVLDFEGEWRRHVGAKEEAIRATLGVSPARYYQVLGRLLDSGDALAYAPMLVKRLRRLRDGRQAQQRAREQALGR